MGLHLYLGFKLLHVLAVVLFLGNITTGVFWKANADRTRNPVVIANMLEGIIRADRLFTIPPIALILAGGIGAAVVGKYPILGTGWIFWSIVLFTISGIAFMAVVGPAQRKMLALVRRSGESLDWAAYRALSACGLCAVRDRRRARRAARAPRRRGVCGRRPFFAAQTNGKPARIPELAR